MKLEWPSGRYVFAFVCCLITWTWLRAAADAATFYVAKNGSNSTSCSAAQNPSTPKLTIRAGVACLSGGDTLIIKAVTYAENLDGNVIPSGSSGSPTTLKAETPLTAILMASGEVDAIHIENGSYITFDGLVVDSINVPRVSGLGRIEWKYDSHHMIFRNGEIRNIPGSCMNPGGHHHQVLNSNIHHCIGSGDPNDSAHGNSHGLYWHGSDGVVEGNDIHHLNGYGIQVYAGGGAELHNNIIRNNRFHDRVPGRNGLLGDGVGMYLGATSDNALVSNNVFYNLERAIQAYGRPGSRIYNNTIYNMVNGGIKFLSGSDAIVKNNIIYQTGSFFILDPGSNTKTNNLTSDPKFVNATAHDFHLEAGSLAINAGTNLTTDVPDDLDSVKRPQPVGSAYDIGAYEFVPSPPTPSDTSAPLISAVQATSVTHKGAKISWSTDENSDTQVEYGPTTAYGSSTPLVSAPVTSHSVQLSALQPYTLYHFRVKSRDAAGNLAVSADSSFRTLLSYPINVTVK